ncbi:MAG: energy transducer TonB, partial [Sideroxydans sp.]|nr:energy transducer TonB [Sideroxydans sp.]
MNVLKLLHHPVEWPFSTVYIDTYSHPVEISLRWRGLFVAAVVVLHLAVLGTWTAHHALVSVPHQMSISMAMAQPQQPTPPQPAPPMPSKPVPPVAQPQRVAQAIAPAPVDATPPPAASPAPAAPSVPSPPALADREPDFAAAYLNNPKPVYPLAARRMGWQGKVIVRVEVLASGAAGAVSLYQSSGREALDNAALA